MGIQVLLCFFQDLLLSSSIISVKKEANLSAREVGEVEVGKGDTLR